MTLTQVACIILLNGHGNKPTEKGLKMKKLTPIELKKENLKRKLQDVLTRDRAESYVAYIMAKPEGVIN